MASSYPAESGIPWSRVRASAKSSVPGEPKGIPGSLFLPHLLGSCYKGAHEGISCIFMVPESPHCFQGRATIRALYDGSP